MNIVGNDILKMQGYIVEYREKCIKLEQKKFVAKELTMEEKFNKAVEFLKNIYIRRQNNRDKK